MEALLELIFGNLAVAGVLLFVGALLIFPGSAYLLLFTNVGKKLAFLVAGATLFGWLAINSLLFVLYAPRGPRPADIAGLNAFEIRIIPGAFMLAALILFSMFVTALNRLEEADRREDVS
ncbi:MAG: sugar transferase [Actinomycetota bacterium]|nr:sugar transferase [Actinomycetota bacterium]